MTPQKDFDERKTSAIPVSSLASDFAVIQCMYRQGTGLRASCLSLKYVRIRKAAGVFI